MRVTKDILDELKALGKDIGTYGFTIVDVSFTLHGEDVGICPYSGCLEAVIGTACVLLVCNEEFRIFVWVWELCCDNAVPPSSECDMTHLSYTVLI